MKKTTTHFCFAFILLAQLFASGAMAQQYNKMLVGDNNNGQIVRADVNGNNMDTINLGGLYQSFYDADVDPVNRKIYMAWYYGIYSMNYDGSAFDTLVDYPAGGYSDGVAVDPVNGYIYWTSTPEHTIYRSDLSGKNITPLVTGLGYLADIDIDLVHGYLIYGQWIQGGKGLYRVDLDGSNITTIVAGYDVEFLGLDIKNSTVYFNNILSGSEGRRINYDGSNDTLLLSFQAGGFFVDTVNELVYISDMSAHRVVRTDLNGGNMENLITTNIESPHGPLLYNDDGTVGTTLAMQPQPFTIYPNPTGGLLYVHAEASRAGESYTITDLLGKAVMTGMLTVENTGIDAGTLNEGLYLFRLGDRPQQLFTVIKN